MQTNNARIEVEDLSAVKKKLDITIPGETVKREINSAYQTLKSTANIAGFRKGNIPVNILKARFSDYVQEEVSRKLIERSYPEALRERKLVPVENPHIDIKTPRLEEGRDFTYSVTVEVSPRVEINDYRGMEIKKEKIEVTDKEIEDGLQSLRESRAQFKDVERPANEGDLVQVDFEALINGEPVKNGKGADYPIIIGEKTLLPGFDEALKGTSRGEEKEAEITFPQNYSEGSLAGKAAEFKIKIKAVKEKVTPGLDDEFAKDMECANLDELRGKVKEELVRVKETHDKERMKTEILDKLIEKHSFEVPEALVTRYLGLILNRVIENMRRGDFNPGDEKLSADELKAKYRDMAIRSVKEDIILDEISAKENVQVTEEETEKAVRSLAASRGASYESLMSRIEKEGALEVIKDGMKHEKVFDIIIGASR